MEIPRTKGYTEIVKIAEAALNGDQEKARKYINKYLIKFPESDLVYPFTAILMGDLNPSGLHFCAQAEPVHDASALPIHSVSDTVCDLNRIEKDCPEHNFGTWGCLTCSHLKQTGR